MSRKFQCPILKSTDLATCLRDFHESITPEDIQNANVVVVRKIFESFLGLFLGITKEEMSQMEYFGATELNYPELHEDSIPEFTFYRNVSKMMTSIGVSDFSIRDIISPEPKRVVKHFSVLINFWRFRTERMEPLDEMLSRTDALVEMKRAQELEHEELLAQLHDLQSQRSAEEPALKQIKDECENLEAEINELNKKQAVLRNESGDLKEKGNSLRDELSTVQYSILDAQQEIQRLKAQIVTSPERIKKEIVGIGSTLDEAKREIQEMERQDRSTRTYLESINRAEKDLECVIAQVQEIEEDILKCTEAKGDVRDKVREISGLKSRIETTEAHTLRQRKALQQKNESLINIKQRAVMQIEASDHALKMAQDELHELQISKQETRERAEEVEKNLQYLSQKKQHEEATQANKMRAMIDMLHTTQAEVQQYHQEIISRANYENVPPERQ